jgi:hypothetical protein
MEGVWRGSPSADFGLSSDGSTRRAIFLAHGCGFSDQRLEQSSPQMLRD